MPGNKHENAWRCEKAPGFTVRRRADRLLQFIERRNSHIGARFYVGRSAVHLPESDETYSRVDLEEFQKIAEMFAWSEATNRDEMHYLLDHLAERGWLKDNTDLGWIITGKGHDRLAKLEEVSTDSSRAFVAMWFDDSMGKAWSEGFAPGISDAGYEPVRIDRKEHVNKIDDEIVAEIRRSRFVVADFTQGNDGARGDVYYEAGFAHGLDIPVVFTCRKDALAALHFDTSHYNHIVWKEPEELRRKLATRISAVIGDGPHRNNRAG